VLRATGPETAAFLHGQLTQDMTGLAPRQARLAGYCRPKGRLLGALVIWRDPVNAEDLIALVRAAIAPALAQRVSAFSLRAKVKLAVEPAVVWGVQLAPGQGAPALAAPLAPPEGTAPFSVTHTDQGTWVAAPAAQAGLQRWWLLAAGQAPSAAGDAAGLQ